jgi:ribosomal-protein-alanine acetyltransferase
METEKVIIRPATKADTPDLFRVEQSCFDAESFSRRQVNYLAVQSSGSFWVLTEDEKIAGFIVLLQRTNSQALRIYSLAVLPEFRGRKYAQQLMQKAVEQAQELGKDRLYLEVSEHNHEAIQLYRKLGFELIGIRPRYYRDGSNACLMEKKLDA